MASIDISLDTKKSLFDKDIDRKKAILLTFVAFLFTGFQCAIYGMLTVPISQHFNIDSNTIIFFDGFGLWGQILAMATGGILIKKFKGKNTLIVAALFMIIGSILSIFAPDIYVYTAMTFICNMAVGYVLVSCNYIVMGTVEKQGESEGKLSLLNVFFSLGFLSSAFIVGNILFYTSWQAVFVVVMVLFIIFILFLLSLQINEKIEQGVITKAENASQPRFIFLSKPIVLMAIALFCIVYTEQIMNYYNQPHLHFDLGFNMKDVGLLVAVYTGSQLLGRIFFGKFLLPRVRIERYLVVSGLVFAFAIFIFIYTKSFVLVLILMAILGLSDSCIYPSVLGYAMDKLPHVSSGATSFLVTVGAIGIPLGTSLSGMLGNLLGREPAMLVGLVMLLVLVTLVVIVHNLKVVK
ncbi:MFS transporter [Francisella salimarina]|uniref:MFS transporter n=1 Tax=Francisella salimarina TaxID=2599927 RepID=UPI003D812C5F